MYSDAGRVRREVRQVLVSTEKVCRCWEGERREVREALVSADKVFRCWEGVGGGQAGAGGW